MKKIILFLSLLFLMQAPILSQSSTYKLSGRAIDNTTKETIEYASVRILNVEDSTFVAGASTDAKGVFTLLLKPAKYIVKMSYLGFEDYGVDVNLNKNVSLGDIPMREDAVMLSEAVVETKAIEIMIKGDTVEYNADSYKVQESAVVEDLLRKMPGVEIDEDGKITVNGKEVKKIMLDGKEFFSDDPKVASKNLPARMVEKLQVLDRKSDMAQMTGFDDGEEETIINLTVKPGMKESTFGNALAGYGSEDRYEGAANMTYLRNNTQVSFVGGINNTNNAGSSDLGAAMFGSSGGGGRMGGMRFGGRNGVTKSITGGINFATQYSDKLKWGGDVRYGSNDNKVTSHANTEYTTIDQLRKEITDSRGNNKNNSFATNLLFEWTPDSLTKVIFRPGFEYNTNENIQMSTGTNTFVSNPERNYSSMADYYSEGKGYKLNGNLEMSRKLNDKGRVISLGLRGGLNNSDSDGLDYNKIEYASGRDSIIDQRFFQDDKSYNWRAFLSYVEPLGRNNFLELSYNISNRNSETDKQTYYNIHGEGLEPDYAEIDTLYTRYIRNDFINQNVSLKFKSQREKFNYTIGLGLEPSSSQSTLREPNQPEMSLPRKTFLSFAPSGQFNYLWDKRSNLRVDYRGSTTEPTTLQLYPGTYSRNGLNATSGNPDLRPSFENSLSLRFRKFNPEQASSLMLFGRFSHLSNAIVGVSTWNDSGGKNTTYKNVDGNMNGRLMFMFNRPLRNRSWSINSRSMTSYAINNTFINSLKNKAKTLTLSENAGIKFQSDFFDTELRGNITYNNMRNTISKNNNRSTFNYGGTYDFTVHIPNPFQGVDFFEHILSNLTVESDINYATNSGYTDGFKQQEWLWNASISKTLFKDKAATIRLKMYDILKERSNISRNYTADYIQDITTNTISSYFMVHFVYRFQIFKGGAKREDVEMDGDMRGRGGQRGGRPPH